MTQVEVHHSQRLPSEIHTDTSKELSISSLSKECTQASSSMLAPKHLSPLEIFFQSIKCQRVPSSQTVKVNSETEDLSPEPQALQLLSLVTPMTAGRPESDSHPEPERPFKAPAEPWLESALVDREQISHSSRPTVPGSRQRERESTGQELEVLQ